MLLKNGKKFFSYLLGNENCQLNRYKDGNEMPNIVPKLGTFDNSKATNDVDIAGASYGTPYWQIVIGNGETDVSESDYQLNSLIADSSLSATCNKTYIDNTLVLEKTVRNISSEDITVTEVGFIVFVQMGNNFAHTYLLAREKLETPIVIAPNDYYVFTASFGF